MRKPPFASEEKYCHRKVEVIYLQNKSLVKNKIGHIAYLTNQCESHYNQYDYKPSDKPERK